MQNMWGRGGGGHGHFIRAGAHGLRPRPGRSCPLDCLLLILTMQIAIRRVPKKARPAGLGAGPGNHSHDIPVYWGSITGRALKCVQSGIFLPRFAIFGTVPISFGLAQQARLQARPSMDRRQMSRRACRVASSQTMRPDAQSGLAAKVRAVDQVRRPGARDAARCSHYIVTLPEKTSRKAQGMPREIN